MASADDTDAEAAFTRASDTFERLVRGDAMIGIMAPESDRALLDDLWAAARQGHAEAWKLMAQVHLAYEDPIGAFDGVAPPTEPREWPATLPTEQPEDTVAGVVLRCLYQAARLSDRGAAMSFARVARRTDDRTRETARELLAPYAEDDAGGVIAYELGLLWFWSEDLEQAIACQKSAAERGNGDAMFELYVLHAKGQGVIKDEAEARRWLARAADREHARALFNFGAFYATGNGVEADLGKAVGYYERSARAGNGSAAATLAVMHLTGEGVAEDTALASKWLDEAEGLGFDAGSFLDGLGMDDPRGAVA